MKVINRIPDMKEYLRAAQRQGKTIGFVPTMGYLHEGHLSLIRRAVNENDLVVVSIFVNPTQFGPTEDFEKYPRNFEKDSQLCQESGAHILYYPAVSEMYPEGYKTYVEVEDITTTLCGASRPGHFRGVTTVVTKLFNIIHPDRAYFGQKDAQQAIVIQQMVKDLNMDVQVVVCPIIREEDGLAMSSRNVYLSTDERGQATVLSQSLAMAQQLIHHGEKNTASIKTAITEMIRTKPLAQIDYVSIVDMNSLKEVAVISGKILIALAVKFSNTRLIDNVIVEVS